jgi:hypothetical protein
VVQRVVLYPDSFPALRPSPEIIIILPPPTQEVRGRTIMVRLRVDEKGHVDPGTVVLEGITDNAYAKSFYSRLLSYRFTPAVLEGCAVPSSFSIKVTP